ncbi:MAG: DUF1553 domain-containing protein [Fimbriiglobus sp.]
MRLAALLATGFSLLTGSVATAAEPAGVEFFEKKIRPAMIEHCYKCHSADAVKAKKLKGGLLLDTRAAMLAGGDSGPALVPKKPAASLLIKSLKYDGDLKMPPKGELPAAVIADFEKWVAMGAPAPDAGKTAEKKVGMDLAAGRKFWAYRPPVAPTPPAVKQKSWPAGPIDRFILAKLEAKKLAPAPDADRVTLVRRVYFDLTGLPPTPEQIDAFVSDTDPAGYEKLVDRLLASPAYGERWGRHWLDLARYAESVTLRGLVYKEAWRYRDYVIDSFHRDVPYDRFVKEQIAGDLLPADGPAEKARQIVATTYLQLGNSNLEEQDKTQLRMDVVDEQLDVITKGLLAQTVTCARCHDHKFDPIPTKDYYALAGILRNVKTLEMANVAKWVEVPLPVPADEDKRIAAHTAAVVALRDRIKAMRGKKPAKEPAGVLAVKDIPGIVVDDDAAMKVGGWTASTASKSYIGAGYSHDDNAGKGDKTITFDPDLPATGRYEVRLAYSPGNGRAKNAPVTVFSADGELDIPVDMTPPPPIDGRWLSLGTFRFEKTGQSFVRVGTEDTKGHVTADAVVFLPADGAVKVEEKPAETGSLAALEAELAKLLANSPRRPMAMSVIEEPKVADLKIHVRGSVHNLGEPAPRGFLQVATVGPAPKLPKNQSGRAELAEWIASKDNPLTARVFANRAWHWLFGSGIVRTVDNFGTTGEAPSHPELLDYLATKFVADGWSAKKLVREIVLSRTYRQSSAATSKAVAADPENRLFGRADRRRLDAECIRDGMLAVSGKLTDERGGITFPPTLAADYGYKSPYAGRSVYVPLFRNAIPDLFEVFDFADPSTTTGKRSTSTVSPQALFLMNSPFVIAQARAAAARLLAEPLPDDAARVARAYRLALGRPPTAGEASLAGKFLASAPDRTDGWAAVFQALFASADFRYVE